MKRHLVFLTVLALLAGCDNTGSGTDTAGSPPSKPTTLPPTTPTTRPDWFTTLISSNSTASVSRVPTSSLSSNSFEELLDSLRANLTPAREIAGELNAINPLWSVTAVNITQFASDWCTRSFGQATNTLLNLVPGAGVRALPPLNDAVRYISDSRTCTPRPEALDETYNLILDKVLRNTSVSRILELARSQSRSTTTTVVSEKYLSVAAKGVCAGLGGGFGFWVKENVHSKTGGLLLAIALPAALTFCPSALERVLM